MNFWREKELEDKEGLACTCRRETGGNDWKIESCAEKEIWHREIETRQGSAHCVVGIVTERRQQQLEETTKRLEDHTNQFDIDPMDVQRMHGGKYVRSLSLRPTRFL